MARSSSPLSAAFRASAVRKQVSLELLGGGSGGVRGKAKYKIEMIGDRTQAHIDRVIEAAPTLRGSIVGVLEKHAEKAVHEIRGRWYARVNYRTGDSGEGWWYGTEEGAQEPANVSRARLGRAAKGSDLVYYIWNETTYAQHVHPKGSSKTLIESIVEPQIKAAESGVRRDLAVLFRLAVQKLQEARAEAARSVSAGMKPPGSILSRFRRWLGV